MLALMGFIAYTIAAQEFASALYFAEAAKFPVEEQSPGAAPQPPEVTKKP
jgi:hypothetical protein